jgi:hypothetical protein
MNNNKKGNDMDYFEKVIKKMCRGAGEDSISPTELMAEITPTELANKISNDLARAGYTLLFAGTIKEKGVKWSLDCIRSDKNDVIHVQASNPNDCVFKLWLEMKDK